MKAADRNPTTIDGLSAIDPASKERSMVVYVLTTTFDGTCAALISAATLGRDLGARIILLVPQVVPYTDPLDHPTDRITFTSNRFRQLIEALGTEADIRVCLCRPHSRSLRLLVPHNAMILVGGRRRRMWRSREQRLVAALTSSGRRAMLIEYARVSFLAKIAARLASNSLLKTKLPRRTF